MTQFDKPLPFPHLHHNINLLWASLFMEELTRHGITDFCIAPGSRSTSLTLAVANHPKAKAHVHFDERGLGFLALGLCQATLKPTVIITTSGTAVANLYPAVIEARQSQLPLIIISADRPPELINCGANQAIDQHRIFADYPVFFCQLSSPSESVSSNFLSATLDQWLFQQYLNKGPIHFNMAIPEPFYPDNRKIDFQHYLSSLKNWLTHESPFTVYQQNESVPVSNKKIDLNAEKVLVVVGRIKDKQAALAIEKLCTDMNLLLFADIQSQMQGSEKNIPSYDLLLENDQFKQLVEQADLILQFSDHVVSKRLNQLIGQSSAPVWSISEHSHRIDPSHCISQRFMLSAQCFSQQIVNTQNANTRWVDNVRRYQAITHSITDTYLNETQISEINTTAYTLNQNDHNVVIANSLAIRLGDMFATTNATIYSNRGASGIDGLIATAAGIAKNNDSPTCLLIGDTSFLYDLNSLALLAQLTTPFVIVLLNNDGGGIFNLLPVPEEQLKPFYQNPHGLTFEETCAQFSINYHQPVTFFEFQVQYQDALSKNKHNKMTLIEVCVDNQLTPTLLQKINNEVKHAII